MFDALAVSGRRHWLNALVDVGLLHPRAHRLDPIAELAGAWPGLPAPAVSLVAPLGDVGAVAARPAQERPALGAGQLVAAGEGTSPLVGADQG